MYPREPILQYKNDCGESAINIGSDRHGFAIIFLPQRRAPLAQLDRASGYEPEGREFESLRARHSFCLN